MVLKMNKFNVGDRVTRRENVYDSSSNLMRGSVVRVYAIQNTKFGPYPELYEVRWDNGSVKGGYLPHGLDKEYNPITKNNLQKIKDDLVKNSYPGSDSWWAVEHAHNLIKEIERLHECQNAVTQPLIDLAHECGSPITSLEPPDVYLRRYISNLKRKLGKFQ